MKLQEAKRSELLNKSLNSDKGRQRYKRRSKSSIRRTVSNFNDINMDDLFKKGKFGVNIPVKGETDNYIVTIVSVGFLDELHKQISISKKFDLKTILKTLTGCFDREDVYVSCTCKDAEFRFAYWQSRNKYKAGKQQPSNGKWIRNPNDKLGSGCKHVLLVLSNNSWILPCCRVIFNYVNWMEQHKQQMYADYIYPAIYEKDYEDGVQLDLLATDELAKGNDDEIKAANVHKGRDERGRFNSEQEKGQFKKKPTDTDIEVDEIEQGEEEQ